ncbi:hypothetical protein ASPBRDRAFT_191406 [Aspergillus brasiliensis CBS 101740]|uniref:Uncharacterized protein n=1 Tax=Aspergillus brasiliensis (strain CBS 101740 / IMI 381727 / IBT 21946) TaxID=767769 RepID=A0A1L9V2L5_ASPBC|nr:hypothetical protein ASPBRDRAFT_191406 [Aspergillus brasiliensis CBS 101740]
MPYECERAWCDEEFPHFMRWQEAMFARESVEKAVRLIVYKKVHPSSQSMTAREPVLLFLSVGRLLRWWSRISDGLLTPVPTLFERLDVFCSVPALSENRVVLFFVCLRWLSSRVGFVPFVCLCGPALFEGPV